jgi:hypothetical protein
MLSRLKQYGVLAIFVGAFYYLLSHHIIFSDFKDFDMLKKEKYTFKYTFLSLKQAVPEEILKIRELKDAGIGEVLVDREVISAKELAKLLAKIDTE